MTKEDIKRYDVFISYSRRDYVDENNNVIKGNIISKIKQILIDNNISFWFDEEGIYSGDEFANYIVDAIEKSDVFLFVSTENSNKSEWTSREIAVANSYKKKIIPLKVDNSLYHKSIILYIANLDFIDYQQNPEKSIEKLTSSILDYKNKIEIQRQREQERQKEKENLSKQQELKLVEEIETKSEKLFNDSLKIDLDKQNLLLELKNLKNKGERDRLTFKINTISSNKQERLLKEELQKTISQHKKDIKKILEDIKQRDEEIKKLKQKNLLKLLGAALVGFVVINLLFFLIYVIISPSKETKLDTTSSTTVLTETISITESETVSNAIEKEKKIDNDIEKSKKDKLSSEELYNVYKKAVVEYAQVREVYREEARKDLENKLQPKIKTTIAIRDSINNVIEESKSKNKNKNNNSNNSNNKSNNDDNKSMAEAIEKQADKLGPSATKLNLYKRANTLYKTSRVEDKINELQKQLNNEKK